jgi:DNA-binding HxlR family transcriptional regulator
MKGGIMVITKRDLILLKKLHQYGMLSTNHVNKYVFNDIAQTTVLRRLRGLEREKLITKIVGLESMERLWALTEKGAELVSLKLLKRHFAKGLLEHDYQLLALRLKLEGNGIAHSWIPEHELRSKVFQKYGMKNARHQLIPDGLMGVDVAGKKESVAIELELTMKNERRYYHLFKRYFGVSSTYAVWYVVKTMGQVRQLLKLWNQLSHNSRGIRLYVSLLDQVMKDPLKATIYCADKNKIIENIFSAKPAHPPALGVSTQDDKKIELKNELTEENHAPILDIAS